MRIWNRIFGKGRKKERLEVRVPVRVKTPEGREEQFWTDDLSESGLRMVVSSLSDLTGGRRDVELGLVLAEDEDPVWVVAEPIWTTRTPDGKQSSGWMISQFPQNGQERIADFLRSQPTPKS